MIPLGDPGTTLADVYEEPRIFIETGPASHVFEPAPWPGDKWEVRYGANDAIPTAEILVNIADNPDLQPVAADPIRDWQVRALTRRAVNPWTALLGGRRIRISTARLMAIDDWSIFEGFIDRIEPGWSGASKQSPRWLTIYAVSTIAAADREASQQMWGQWRRHRSAEIALLAGNLDDARTCVRCGVPLVFNPRGKPNCHPTPITFDDESKVYVPCDAGRRDAIPWTVAKALRYIQWAALQAEPPAAHYGYDAPYTSNPLGILALAAAWTSFPIRHLNLNGILEDLLDEPPDTAAGPFGRAALLRAIPDMGCEGMSTLEAFAYLSDLAGMLMYVDHGWAVIGQDLTCLTRLGFAVRGIRQDPVYMLEPGHRRGGADPSGIDPAGQGTGNKGRPDGVMLMVPRDQYPSSALTEAEMIARGNATEGALLLDDSGRRAFVRINGAPIRYEITVELRPGWRPDANWDVAPAGVTAAIEATRTVSSSGTQGTAWEQLYVGGKQSTDGLISYRDVGRYWVLNEDGSYTAADFQRSSGPWSGSDVWAPFDWREEGHIPDLVARGGDGWTPRRRRFLPCDVAGELADGTPSTLKHLLEVSYDGGTTWEQLPGADIVADTDRCAIRITSPADLRELIPLSSAPPYAADNFVTAYIRGNLRLRLTAVIEGDDVLRGLAGATPDAGWEMPWAEHLDRPDQFRKTVRHADCSRLVQLGATEPPTSDDQPEIDAAAARCRNEFQSRRSSGQVTIPYLLRKQPMKPWQSYQIGDEIDILYTQGDTALVFFTGVDAGQRRAPRVVGITFRWARDPQEISTTLMIEDEMYGVDDLVGQQVVENGT